MKRVTTNKMIGNILHKLDEVQKRRKSREVVIAYNSQLLAQNELVFFIKPEIASLEAASIQNVLEIVLKAFEKYNVHITGANIISGEYLDKWNIMDSHYGVVSSIAREGYRALSGQAIITFRKLYSHDPYEEEILGAHQFLHEYPDYNSKSLYALWEKSKVHKLASSTYCKKIKIENDVIFLLNGFQPYLLSWYASPTAYIIVFSLQSDGTWHSLRNEMLGSTNPVDAGCGSIRRTLLEQSDNLNIPVVVGRTYNCVHLSAGPLESISELMRFMTDGDVGIKFTASETALGSEFLRNGIAQKYLSCLLSNPILLLDGTLTSAFEKTECMDTKECVNYLLEQEDIISSQCEVMPDS